MMGAIAYINQLAKPDSEQLVYSIFCDKDNLS
jgi:hypothetical protein